MNNRPRVSIGMPVFNAEKYIIAAIDSILAQTFSDFELIISDNASTDRTHEICKEYSAKDQRIHYYRNKKNLGIGPNFNRVLELSVGKYFKWAAHDDVVAPTFMEKCVEVLDSNPEVIICYSSTVIIDESGEFVVNQDSKPVLTSLGPHQRFGQFILTNYAVYHLSGLLRANIIKKIGGLGNYPASDEVLLAELSLHGQFHEIPERLFFFRRHPENSTFGAIIPDQENPIQFKQRNRVLWFDTSYEGKIVLPTWQFLLDGLRAIRQAPIGGYQRAYSYAQMFRWMFVLPHFRALGKDILLAIYQLSLQIFAFPKDATNKSA